MFSAQLCTGCPANVLAQDYRTAPPPPFSTATTMAGKFEPKVPVQLDPPKDDPISAEELAKANGMVIWLAQVLTS